LGVGGETKSLGKYSRCTSVLKKWTRWKGGGVVRCWKGRNQEEGDITEDFGNLDFQGGDSGVT